MVGQEVSVQETALPRMAAVLRSGWWLVLLIAAPVVAVAVWYAVSREPDYRTQVVLSFSPDAGSSADSSFLRLVRRYQFVATGPEALDAAASAAGLPRDPLGGAVTVESPGDTLQMTVTVRSGSAGSAEAAAGAIADVVVASGDQDPRVDADVLVEPSAPANLTPLRQVVAVSAGALVGLVPGIGVVFLLEGVRPTIRTRRDVKALGIPLIATVRRKDLGMSRARRSREPAPLHLPELRAELQRLATGTTRPGVVLMSASSRDAAVVAALAERLRLAGATQVRVQPSTVDGGGVPSTVAGQETSLLVITGGTSTDDVDECLQTLGRLEVEVIGAVLVR